MASIDDEQLNKNAALFISVRQNKSVEEKIENVAQCLEDGADVNAADGNNFHNTPMHDAVRRSEADIIRLLVDNGANMNIKNSKGETPLAIAQSLNSTNKQEIINILQATEKSNNMRATAATENGIQQSVDAKIVTTNTKKQKEYKYLKRAGTSGVSGQLYESKLLCLVLMKALNDEDIEIFNLGTNNNGIGDLDDICLRFRTKGNPKPVVVCVQAKHKENGKITAEDLRSAKGDFSLRKYFDSYLTIKESFQTNNKDIMFDGDFESVECILIIYTPATESFNNKKTDTKINAKVHKLINTGINTEVFQINHDEISDEIDFLTKMTVIDRIKKLGSLFLQFILAKSDKSEVFKTTKLITRYHVIMGREVLQQITNQEPNLKNRMWKFNPDFFTSDCEYSIALRETFYNDLSTTRCDNTKIVANDKVNFLQILQDPCASNISTLIGKMATYNRETKTLKLMEVKHFKKMFNAQEYNSLAERLSKTETNENIVNEAVRLKLESIEFALPLWFGNIDMTLKDAKREKTVVGELIKLLDINKGDTIVEINDGMVGQGKIEKGILDVNGGIGSAVGNLLVFDAETKMMKLDVDNEKLPNKASSFLNELKNNKSEQGRRVNQYLRSYRIKVNIDGFPKDSFHGDEYDKRQARDFLSKLWFYANQAKEDEVERIVKRDINKYYKTDQLKFKIQTDAFFLRAHDKIQKWWLQTGKAPYLNETSELFEQAMQVIIDNTLTVLNFMYNLKLENIAIKFKEDVIRSLQLDAISERVYNVITDANILTGIKIMQYFETQDKYTFIEFDYVLSLPLNDYNTMIQELKQTKIETLIIIYEKLKYYEGLCNKLKEVLKLFNGKNIIVVTERVLADEIKEYVGNQYQSVRDDRTYMIDLAESSQTKILEESTIVFQGEELPFKRIQCDSYDEKSRELIRTEVLYKLIYREKIEIGQPLMDQIYKEIKEGKKSFIERKLSRDDTYPVNTLKDIDDNVVVVSGRPGIGRSALLTHLSLNTKLIDPLPWIVRVNLPDYEKQFHRWQEESVAIEDINVPLVLHFLCTTALKNIDLQMKIKLIYHEGTIYVGEVDENIDPLALYELELFLHLYNVGKVIFLFDDFNAICPHYEIEVTELLKLLKDEGKRIWITTCSYKHTRITLEKELQIEPYKLVPFNHEERKVFLNRFFRTNLRLEKLNYDQFENVRSFLKFMSKVTNVRLISEPDRDILPLFSLMIHLVYKLAIRFFKSEINRASSSTIRSKLKENFDIDLDKYSPMDELLGRTPDDEELELAGTPLHLYIAANYFRFRIEESLSFLLGEEEVKNKWNLMLNSFTLYRHFVEAHMKRIFFKEEADDMSVVSTVLQTRKEFLEKHKKLGLFTLCRERDLNKLLKPDEILEIQNTIAKIQRGEDRTSLINCVVNEVPRFAHLVFAEYFAVECLTDMMKAVTENNVESPLKNASLWQSILNILLFNASPGVRKAFNYKLQSDDTLAKLANGEVCRKVVFELLLKNRRDSNVGKEGDTPVIEAFEEGLFSIGELFLSSVQSNLNRGNVDEIRKLIGNSRDKFMEFGKEYAEIIINVAESVQDMNVEKLGDILKSGRLTEVPLRHANAFSTSETASELLSHVAASTSQIPALTNNVQQLFQQSDGIGQTFKSLVQLGMKTAISDLVTKLKPPDPELD